MDYQQRKIMKQKEQETKVKTYHLTEDQLQAYIKEAIEEVMKELNNTATILLLTLPLEVLMDHYWPKSYRKRIPEFTKYMLEYCEHWQDGTLDIDKLKEDLWKYGGIRLEVEK